MRLVNLCFHGVGEPARELEPDEEQYWIDVDRFEDLLDVAAADRSIRLTFDDGNLSDRTVALPALLERGLTASFFVIAGRLDCAGSLAPTDLRALADAGMSIGSHGLEHRAWRGLGAPALNEELDGAVAMLAAASGRPIHAAACPYGSYDRRVLTALRRRGFASVYTVDRRSSNPADWLQARYVIRDGDTPDDVRRFGREGRARSVWQATKGTVKRWR